MEKARRTRAFPLWVRPELDCATARDDPPRSRHLEWLRPAGTILEHVAAPCRVPASSNRGIASCATSGVFV